MSPDPSPGTTLGESGALSHVDGAGRARMVDVTGKPWTHRRALARCKVVTAERGPATARSFGLFEPADVLVSTDTGLSWPQILVAARLAGIQAAKQTSNLIPLCHPLSVSKVEVRMQVGPACIEVEGEAETTGPTGVEMEALTACAVAALTIVGSLGSGALDASVEDLALWEKSGGRSGTWLRRG